MPTLKVCATPQCGTLTRDRHCPEHTLAEKQRRYIKDQAAGYHTQHWHRLRRQAIHLHPYCDDCGSVYDLTVHLRSELQGNHHAAALADCTVLCRSCHGTRDARRAHD